MFLPRFTVHRLPQLLLLVSSALATAGPAGALHGGAYRGPADLVPVAGANAPGGGVPGPRLPGAAGRVEPAPQGPLVVRATPSLASSTPPDLDVWQLWWGYNCATYLPLREAIHSSDLMLGSVGSFLGRRSPDAAAETLAPSPEDVQDRIVPALLAVLEEARDADMLTGALVALAKVGEEAAGGVGLAPRLAAFLVHDNQEVAETAAICMGILADRDSVPALVSLLRDDENARALLGEREVPLRSRAFAAYGLGLTGHRHDEEELRISIVRELLRMVEDAALEQPTPDVAVACLSALGLVPLAYPSAAPGALDRRAQIDALLDLAARADVSPRIRAHVPTAVARLVQGTPPSWGMRSTILWRWLEELESAGESSRFLEQSLVSAVGRLADADDDAVDRHARARLRRLAHTSPDLTVRRFALIAMAESAGRPGSGRGVDATRAALRGELLAGLREGQGAEAPWAALSLGVLGRALLERGHGLDPEVDQALVEALEKARAPREVGALSMALGMRAQRQAAGTLLRQMATVRDDETRGYVALALGMAGAEEALEPVTEVVRRSRYRPALLRQSAISLGLLGDKQLVPELIEMLRSSTSLSAQASVAYALGAIGDARSIDPLLEMLDDAESTPRARAFAAVALGIVSDKEAEPWNAKLSIGINYRANTATLIDGSGAGILEIL